MPTKTSSPEEVSARIQNDWKLRKLTQREAAKQLGMTPQAVNNMLSRHSRFRVGTARHLNSVFGYSMLFLVGGEGELYDSTNTVSPKTVIEDMQQDWSQKGLSIDDVALSIIESPALIKKHIEQPSFFDMRVAQAFRRMFNYSPRYLMYGKGHLYNITERDEQSVKRLVNKITGELVSISLDDNDNLTPREALLQKYSTILECFYDVVSQVFPGGYMDLRPPRVEYDCFLTGTEEELFKQINNHENLLRQMLNPENILKELDSARE